MGADAYTLGWIIHDWSDPEAMVILEEYAPGHEAHLPLGADRRSRARSSEAHLRHVAGPAPVDDASRAKSAPQVNTANGMHLERGEVLGARIRRQSCALARNHRASCMPNKHLSLSACDPQSVGAAVAGWAGICAPSCPPMPLGIWRHSASKCSSPAVVAVAFKSTLAVVHTLHWHRAK